MKKKEGFDTEKLFRENARAGCPTFVVDVIANFASQHMRGAVMFHNRVAELEAAAVAEGYEGQRLPPTLGEIRAFAAACIMSFAAALEALINELFLVRQQPDFIRRCVTLTRSSGARRTKKTRQEESSGSLLLPSTRLQYASSTFRS